MAPRIRTLREGIEDEAPIHYEGLPLRASVRRLVLPGGVTMVLLGLLGMIRGTGTVFEPAGAVLGALGVVALILSRRFRLFEIVVGDRWLIVRCGPIRHRFGRDDVSLGEDRPASSWRWLYGEREMTIGRLSNEPALAIPVADVDGLRRAVPGESG